MTQLLELPRGNYDVYLGAIPINNPQVVINFMTIKNFTIGASPDSADALKTINGVSVSEYIIVAEDSSYGSKLAAQNLANQLYLMSGLMPSGNDNGHRIIIKTMDDYSSGKVSGGTYSVSSDGADILLCGSGVMGPQHAADAFIGLLEGKTSATVTSVTEPIVKLPKSAEMIADGKIKIGFIGDSVTYGHGPVTPWPTYFGELLRAAYPETEFDLLNVAVSGQKSAWAEQSIKKLLLDTGYSDLIFIAIGTNDKFQQGELSPLSYEETYANYVSMIEQIRTANKDCEIVFVLCGRDFEAKWLKGAGGSLSPFMKAMMTVAEEYKLSVIDPMSTLYEACFEQEPDDAWYSGWFHYMQDEVHPNKAGQELYGSIVFEYIINALK